MDQIDSKIANAPPWCMLPLGVCSKLVLATKESSDEVFLQNKVSRQVHIYIMMMIICMTLIGEQAMDL